MNHFDMIDCLDEIGRVYPRFKAALNDYLSGLWLDLVGKSYNKNQFQKAFKRYVAHEESAPTIASMKKYLAAECGAPKGNSSGVKIKMPYTRIEFCMDMLGTGLVNDEIRRVTGFGKTKDLTKACGSTDWLPNYKKLKEELFGFAMQKWDEGYRPPKRFLGDPVHEIPWDIFERPEFENDRIVEKNLPVKAYNQQDLFNG